MESKRTATTYFIPPGKFLLMENALGNPDLIQSSVSSDCRVTIVDPANFPLDELEQWPTFRLTSADIKLKLGDGAYYIYIVVPTPDNTESTSAFISYNTALVDREGYEVIETEDEEGNPKLEQGELLGKSGFKYYQCGVISARGGNASAITAPTGQGRLLSVDLGVNPQDANLDKKVDWDFFYSLFKPHYDDPKDPTKLTWIEAKSHMGIQGGVTMYAMDKDVDVPSLASGLPFDGRTIWYNPETNQIEVIGGTGGGSGEGVSNFWDLSGIPSWITNSKPKYSYSEIEGTPDLSGYATQTWVKNQGYLTQHQDLSGYQPLITSSNKLAYSLISGTPTSLKNPNALSFGSKSYDGSDKVTLTAGDLGALTSHQAIYTLTFQSGAFASGSFIANSANKTINIPTTTSHISEGSNLYFTNTRAINALAETLKAYVTLGGTETITGEKNFTGGLKVNGSPIVYDATKKYWKLEGDLLVTGGVTMYGSDSSFTPSTIMDAIAVDGTTISKSGGVLKVIGGTGGGSVEGLSSVAYSGKYDDLIGKPTLLSSFTDDVVRGKYLPLSGGTLTGNINLKAALYGESYISWKDPETTEGGYFYGTTFCASKNYTWTSSLLNWNVDTGVINFKNTPTVNGSSVWHSGNFTPSNYLPLSGGQLNREASISWGNASNGLTDTSDWNIKTDGLRILSSITSGSNAPSQYAAGLHVVGRYGFQIACEATSSNFYMRNIRDGVNNWCKLWHTGNDGSGSGLDADLLDNHHEEDFVRGFVNNEANLNTPFTTNRPYIWRYGNENSNIPSGASYYSNILHVGVNGADTAFDLLGSYYTNRLFFRTGSWSADGSGTIFTNGWKEIAFTDSNVASATKLQIARTIWGQSFDGTGNISGDLNLGYNKLYIGDGTNNFFIGWGADNMLVYQNYYGHYFTTKGERRMIINGSGNVGIGTTSPKQKLHVEGAVQINGQIIGATSIVSNTTNGYFVGNRNDGLGVTDGGLLLYTYGKTPISFYAGGERMRIDASTGYVGIGTSIPYYKLDVNGVAKATSLYADSYVWLAPNSDAIYINDTAIAWHNSSNAWTDTLILFARNSITLNKNTTVQGNILATGGITMYSMRTLKNVVDERGLSLEELSAIKPTRYTWKDGRDNRLHFGGIADDIQQVLPEVVYSTSDGILTMDYGNAAFAVASSLINPVVDHEKRIAMLEEENKELRNEIERLKAS